MVLTWIQTGIAPMWQIRIRIHPGGFHGIESSCKHRLCFNSVCKFSTGSRRLRPYGGGGGIWKLAPNRNPLMESIVTRKGYNGGGKIMHYTTVPLISSTVSRVLLPFVPLSHVHGEMHYTAHHCHVKCWDARYKFKGGPNGHTDPSNVDFWTLGGVLVHPPGIKEPPRFLCWYVKNCYVSHNFN